MIKNKLNIYVVKANEKGPITQIKNPIIYNQRPKFKDLNLKIPILVLKIPPLLLNFHLILSFNMIDPAPAASSTAHPGPTHEKSLRWLRRWRMVAPDNTVAPSPRRISPWKWLSHLHEKIFAIDRNKSNKKAFKGNDAGGGADNPRTLSRASASSKRSTTIPPRGKPSRSIVRRSVVRWNGVCWHDIKSGGVERMISLAATKILC